VTPFVLLNLVVVLLRHFCFKQSQMNITGKQAMQLALSVFPNVLGKQMSKKRRVQDEGRTLSRRHGGALVGLAPQTEI